MGTLSKLRRLVLRDKVSISDNHLISKAIALSQGCGLLQARWPGALIFLNQEAV